MPWTVKNPPSVAKNWTTEEKRKCVKAANATLKDGKSEEDAIFACIHAAGKSKKQEAEPMPNEIEAGATDAEKKAQQARSRRYGISVRKDGNVTKPSEWSKVKDSEFGDPVNYLYPCHDETHCVSAKGYFKKHSGKYNSKNRSIVRGRINRLCRKHGVDPMDSSDDEENAFSQGYFVGEIMLNEEAETEDNPRKGLYRIPAARTANLTRKIWFWEQEIFLDEDLFDSFIDNWQTDVVGHQLAIDASHKPWEGALAWIEDMAIEDGNLVLYANPTSDGEDKLGDTYRYASIWYTDNFVDQETQIEYGPTLLGCAATNTPFVHRQDPMSVVMSDGQTAPPITNNYILVYDQSGQLLNQYDDALTVSAANTQPEPDTQDAAGLEILDQEEDMSDKDTKETPQILRVGDMELTVEDVQKILGEQQQAEARNAKLELELQKAKVDELCNKASDRGVAPIVVQTTRQILMACDMVAEPSIPVTMRDDGEDKEEKLNLFDAVAHVLSVVPGRIGDTPELTYSQGNDGAPPKKAKAKDESDVLYTEGDEDMTPEQAEELARKRREKLGIKTQEDAEL